MSTAAALARALRRVGKNNPDLIADWKWRELPEVQREVGLQAVPDYITDTYGQFMAEQAARAAKGDLGPRDLIKAYGITRSSVNRGARVVDDDIASGSVRPEGYFSEWLLTPQGRRYLDAAERGEVDPKAVADIEQRFTTFGMAPTLGEDLRWAAGNLPQLSRPIVEAIGAPKQQWREVTRQLRGIGPSKAGFMASMLGRGDLPTLDARQLKLHTGEAAADASKYMRRGDGAGGDLGVDRLAERQAAMALELDPALAPYYQHLTHHAVWDKAAGTRTTHDDLVQAMQRGAATPGALAATAGGAAALAAALRYFGSGTNQTRNP